LDLILFQLPSTMAFARASFVRGAFRAGRTSRPAATRTQAWRQIGQRGYASGGHEATKAGGDLPWLIGSVGVTVPTIWYLLANPPEAPHGDDEHGAHGAHGKGHEEEESKDESEDDKSEDSGSEEEGKEADTPDTSDDEGETVTKSSEEGETDETRKHIPDAKGGAKKRIEGAEGKAQGVGEEEEADKPAASKPAGDQNTMSGKQEGLSNTDTKHSTDITNNPEKSTKGEGTPETSKSKGTVDPSRPQTENSEEKKETK